MPTAYVDFDHKWKEEEQLKGYLTLTDIEVLITEAVYMKVTVTWTRLSGRKVRRYE